MISSPEFRLFSRRMQIALRGLSIAILMVFALSGVSGGLPHEQSAGGNQPSPTTFPAAGRHGSFPSSLAEGSEADAEVAQIAAEEAAAAAPTMAPTRHSFLATWPRVKDATAYELDVSVDPTFSQYIGRYHQLSTGNVPFEVVTGLEPSTRYYYRVRIHDATGGSRFSETMTGETNAATGLNITPVFDSSITTSPKSAAIRSTIITAIGTYEALYQDPIEIKILFRYSPDEVGGGPPLPAGLVSRSNWVYYNVPWSSYLSALKADASTQNDATAKEFLPTTALAPVVGTSSAVGRAVGLDTPPAMNADGTIAVGAPFDGIVTFNSSAPLRFTRPAVAGSFDALAFCEHEIDEVMGMGSHLDLPPGNLRPQDLFSWAAPHARNTSSIGTRYFSIDPGVTKIAEFNRELPGDRGDWASSAECPNPNRLVQDAFGCPGQSADVTLSSPEGVSLDVIGYDLTGSSDLGPPTLANISTRLQVQTGDGVLIGGFIVGGTDPKRVLVRAIGPSLSLPGALLNPTLELHSTDSLIASNDNWQSDQKAEIVATTIPPTNPLESAVVATLDPGDYTAIVQGANGGTGVSLVEVYDLDRTTGSTLSNISTRGFVGTDENVLIGGFIILGGDSARVLMRAIGPSLPVTGALLDPTLELHDSNGVIMATDDNWRDDQEVAIEKTGIPPAKDAEAAIVSTLTPGGYTVIVRGQNNTTGVALVEAYRLPDSP